MRVLHIGDDFAALRPCGLTYYADGLMQAQRERGDDVGYVFSGRHYPYLRVPRLKRWDHAGVQMFELLNAPNHSHWSAGTREPLRDLEEAAGDAAVATALREFRPDVVHVQELARLPSSVLDVARESGVPVAMTLHDYKPVCASVQLLDADGLRCERLDVGADCARNCAGAPDDARHLIDLTLGFERRRERSSALVRHMARVPAALALTNRSLEQVPAGDAPSPAPLPEHYQRRRDVNVERLNRCDRLIAPSARLAELYAALGVQPERIVVQRLALEHIEPLRPGRDAAVGAPLTFVTLNAAASRAKGGLALAEAVEALERAGRGDDFRLLVLGRGAPAIAERLGRCAAVTLHGSYAPEELSALLDGGDVGIVPSIWEEAHGFVGIELLAKGLPVIGSALGGIPEYVREGETGWLNHTADGAGLAALMTRALDDPAEVVRLRESVRALRPELVRRVDDHVEEVAALYAELVADQAARISSPAARRPSS